MDSLYVDELKKSINDLMSNLESLPVHGGSEQKFLKNDVGLSKLAFALNSNVKITCKEVHGLKSIPTNRIVYCTMEVEGGEKYRTEHAEAGKPVWESSAEFPTNQILPIIKVKLFMENPVT
ncbi:unnamed protein product [Rotaria sp. Silwood2]|nr:unnamed protein product [Rotaria sp. Silwood2]CAF2910440.1 unnamed protein product [Rotaria sp. Silwood2]CAF3071916.1 unnamed protein product [Rotaria sp. Silwood2]CAF3487290.1 unnamed protein product [Rotaria sp. Silwood2]CAF4138349.1 unnamed protein product [Rotaria sp. Silwood2]